MADTMNSQMKHRITIRLTDHQLQMVDLLQKKILPELSRSEILRTMIEVLYANANKVVP